MLAGKKSSVDGEVIPETGAHFERKANSYYKNGIEKVYDRFNHGIVPEGNYDDECTKHHLCK